MSPIVEHRQSFDIKLCMVLKPVQKAHLEIKTQQIIQHITSLDHDAP